MKNNSLAFWLAVLTLMVGVMLTIGLHHLDIKESATIIAVLIMPLLVYGVASGKIMELSAPGGWTAKFQEVVRQKVSTTAKSIADDTRKLVAVPKLTVNELKLAVEGLEKGEPVALTLFWGRENYQVLETVRQYLTELRKVDPALLVVLVDTNTNRFVCVAEGDTFAAILDAEQQRLIVAINDGDLGYIKNLNNGRRKPVFNFKRLVKGTTNAAALQEMKRLNTRMIVVVDDDDVPEAVVTRDDIIAHVVEEILSNQTTSETRTAASGQA